MFGCDPANYSVRPVKVVLAFESHANEILNDLGMKVNFTQNQISDFSTLFCQSKFVIFLESNLNVVLRVIKGSICYENIFRHYIEY